MKYWIFQNNQVNGPYEVEELAQLPGYSAETLVCPEGRRGTNMGDWQRAAMVPELSVSLLKAQQLAATLQGSGKTSAYYASLPPEPTLKDLAALGSLQEKVALLENSLAQLQEALRLKETEILSLHRELEEKNAQAQELAVKLGGLEERLSSVSALREGLDKAVHAEKQVESTVEGQKQTIASLTSQIAELTRRLEQTTARIEELQREARERPAPELKPEPLRTAPPALEIEPPLAAAKPPPFSPFSAPAAQPAPAPSLGELPPAPSLKTPTPAPALEPPAAPLGEGLLQPQDAAVSVPVPESPGSEAPAPATIESLTAAPTSTKRSPILAIVLVLLIGGGLGAAYMLGLIPGGAVKPAVEPLPPPPSPGDLTPSAPSQEDLLEQGKQAAISLVRDWPTPDGQTVGGKLEALAPASGTLNPWTADKIGEGIFQVHYFAQGAPGGSTTYEFEARPGMSSVTPKNDAAKQLLSSPPPKPRPAVRPKRAKKPAAPAPAPAEAALLDNLLEDPGPGQAAPTQPTGEAVPAPRKARAPKAAPQEKPMSLDDLLGDAPESQPRSKPKPKPEESLDEMLLPGIPARGELDEPRIERKLPPKAGEEKPAVPETRVSTGEDLWDEEPAPKPAKADKKEAQKKAADAALLDDLLRE